MLPVPAAHQRGAFLPPGRGGQPRHQAGKHAALHWSRLPHRQALRLWVRCGCLCVVPAMCVCSSTACKAPPPRQLLKERAHGLAVQDSRGHPRVRCPRDLAQHLHLRRQGCGYAGDAMLLLKCCCVHDALPIWHARVMSMSSRCLDTAHGKRHGTLYICVWHHTPHAHHHPC